MVRFIWITVTSVFGKHAFLRTCVFMPLFLPSAYLSWIQDLKINNHTFTLHNAWFINSVTPKQIRHKIKKNHLL